MFGMYKGSKDKPIPVTQSEQAMMVNMEDVFDKLRKRNVVRAFTAAVPSNDGSDY